MEEDNLLGKLKLEFDGTPESVERNIEKVSKWMRSMNDLRAQPTQEEKYKLLHDKVKVLCASTEGKKSEDWTLDEMVTLTELWIENCVLMGDYKNAVRLAQAGLTNIKERVKGLLKW